jgi:hypothetical protein
VHSNSSPNRAGSQALCAAVDVQGYQQALVPLVWQQLQSPLLSPTTGLVPITAAAATRQQADTNQHVLPGIAALLQRRHEQQQHQQPALLGSSSSSAVAGGIRATIAQATQNGQLGKGDRFVVATAAADGGSGSDMGCGLGDPGAIISRHSSNERAARAPGEAAGKPLHGGRSSGDGSNVSVAALLCDEEFISGVLSSLPGVNPQSGLVWETVAELREALSAQSNAAAQGHERPL